MRLAILALLLTAIVGVACGGEPDRPALIPVPGTVAFTIGVDLWLREDGEERLLVEPGEGRQAFAPALSPDGERIAFVRFQLTGGVDLSVGADLMIVDANGEVSTLIEHDQQAEYFWYPRWSSDGRSIVYTHEAPDIEISIERVDLATGDVTVLRTLARDGDISPDGSRLVFIDDPYGGAARLVVRDLATGDEYPLDPDGVWPVQFVRIPRWSPDGQSIVFAGSVELSTISSRVILRENGPEDIWRVDSGGGMPRLIAALTEDQPDFAFSSDGRHVLARGSFGVYLVEVYGDGGAFAVAPGEFHGWHDWRGRLTDEEWDELIERAAVGAQSGAQ